MEAAGKEEPSVALPKTYAWVQLGFKMVSSVGHHMTQNEPLHKIHRTTLGNSRSFGGPCRSCALSVCHKVSGVVSSPPFQDK